MHLTRVRLVILVLPLVLASSLFGQESREDLIQRETQLRAKLVDLLKSGGIEDTKAQRCLWDHAEVLFQLAEYKKSLKQYQTLQKGQFRSLPRDSEQHVHTGLRIAECYAKLNNERKAKKAVDTIVKYCRKNYAKKERLEMLGQIAYKTHGMQLYAASSKAYKEAYDGFRESRGPQALKTLYSALGYTACQIELNNGDKVAKFAEETLELWEKHHPEDTGNLVLRNNLSTFYIGQGRYKEAKDVIEPVVGRLEGSDLSPDLTQLLRENYARALMSVGKPESALPILEKLIEELKRNPVRNRDRIKDLEELRDACKEAPHSESDDSP
ncbi:MAG: hypothetical protein AAF581_08805 [Planctomycetota bacterium]